MELYGPDLLVFETTEVSFGYQLLAEILSMHQEGEPGLQVLEGTPHPPGKFFCLLNGETKPLVETLHLIDTRVPEEKMIEYRHISAFHPDLLKGLYSMLKRRVDQNLLILEMSSLSQNLFATNFLIREVSLELVDLRSSRGMGGKTLSFLTGQKEHLTKAVQWLEQGTAGFVSPIVFELIQNPPPKFLEFFNL